MDNINKNKEMNEEIVKLNEDFGITRDGVNLVTFGGQQISLQRLNGDISSIINFLQNNNDDNNFDDEEFYDIKPNKKLLDERLKNVKLPVECTDKLIKTETIDDLEEQIIEYPLDRLNETIRDEYSFVDCIQQENFKIDTEGASCSKNFNEHITNALKVCDKKVEIGEDNLPAKIESRNKSSQIKSNPIKGKSLLNSNKNVVKSSTKGRSLLQTSRNLMKTLDNEIVTNETFCTKLKESTSHTKTSNFETTIDTLPVASEIQFETNKTPTPICAKATESSGQFKQIAKNTHLIKLKCSLNSSRTKANSSVKQLTSLLKSNRNIANSQINKKKSKPEIQIENYNSDTTVVSKPVNCKYRTGISQTDTTVNRNQSEITESDLQIVRNRNLVKGKSLINSSRNVVKNARKLRSVLKPNRKNLDNQNDKKVSKTAQTESLNQSETTEPKLIKSETQFIKYNSNTTDPPIALNKSNGQFVKKSNPIKGKSLLNSRRNVVKSSVKLMSLLKANRNIIQNQIDTKKSDSISTQLTKSARYTETSHTGTALDSKPRKTEIQMESTNADTADVLKSSKILGQMESRHTHITMNSKTTTSNMQIEINKSDSAVFTEPMEVEVQIEKNKSNTVGMKLTESILQLETKKIDSTECTKPEEAEMQKETNKSNTAVSEKPVELDMQDETNKSNTAVSVKLVELGRQMALNKFDAAECAKTTELDLQIGKNKCDTSECTETMDLEIQVETKKSNIAVCTKPTETGLQIETNKLDTVVCAKPIETNLQRATNRSEIAVVMEPKESDLLIETNKSDTGVCVQPIELELGMEVIKSDIAVYKKPLEVEMQKEKDASDNAEFAEATESELKIETNKCDITLCTKPIESDIQIETSKSDYAMGTKLTEQLDLEMKTNKSGTELCTKHTQLEIVISQSAAAECVKHVELDKQEETNISGTTECTLPIELDLQKETNKTDIAECTEPVKFNMQKETNESENAVFISLTELNMQKEINKSDTVQYTKPVELGKQKETIKSDSTECTKPGEADIQKETSKTDTTEYTNPVEVLDMKEKNKSDTTECPKPVEVDVQKESNKSGTRECTKPVKVYMRKRPSKSDTTECTKPVDVDLQKETNNFDSAVCTEVKVDIQRETKNSDAVIFKIPQVPVRKIIRKLNSDIEMSTKSTVGRNAIVNSDKIIFKKPERTVSRTNNQRKMWKGTVINKSDIMKFNQRNNSKYSADTFIKKRLLKRKDFDRSVATCSKKPKLTGSFSPIICTKSLECDNQKTSSTEICVEDISAIKDDCLLDCISPVEECNDMPQFTETQINEQLIDLNINENLETNEISSDDILWSTGDDLEIIKRSSETITVDSDTDSNYSISSFYDELVEQKLFTERPEGYPRIRVRTDLMPRSPNEAKQICGITLLRNAQGRYVCAVMNVEEFKKKYRDRNLKLLLKKPNFRMDLHRVYSKISKMVSEGTYSLDELKEYLIENLDKVMSEFEMYVSLKKKHKEFYESELEAAKDLAAELEIGRRIQKKKLERTKTIADIKKKSWCRVCLKEATIHCASAKYYCSVNCQNRDSIISLGPELSVRTNMARTTTERNMGDREDVSPVKVDNGGQHVQSSNSGLKIAEVWSLNHQEEQEVAAASETGRIAVLKRRNYTIRKRKETVSKVTRKRESRSKSKDVFSGQIVRNVAATSYKDPPRLNLKRVCPSPNVNPLKKPRCDLKNISKLNTTNKLNLGKVNKVMSRTEGTVNVPALIIDFPKNKPSNVINMNKSPQNLLLSKVHKQDGQLKNTPLRLYNFQTNSTMPNLILNNFKPQNKDINKNSQILQVAQPKSTSQHLQLRPNNQNQNLLMANMFRTGDTGLNKQYTKKINTSVNNKNIPIKSLLLSKERDMPSTSGIHRIVMAQDLEKPGPSGLNTKSTCNSANTVRYPTKPTNTFVRNPTKPPTVRYPIKPTSTPSVRYLTKPTSTPNIRYVTKPTNISTKYSRKPTINTQPILSLPTTTQPILPLPTTTQPILQLPTNYATNIRMTRPIINNFSVTNTRKVLFNNNPRPMGPRFLFPKPTRPDNLKQNHIKTPPTVKTFLPTPNISQSQRINNNNNLSRINRTTALNIIPNKVTDIPIRVSPFSNTQSLPNLAKTLIVAKDNTYKLAVPSVRSDNTSKPVYIIKDLPQKMEF